MIDRRQNTRHCSVAYLAAVLCLAAAFPAIAVTNPTVPPLTIRIDPIVPRGGAQAPPDQHFPQLDGSDLSLQDALYGAWRRRTRRELAVTMPPEVIKDAAEEIAKTNERATAAVAQYIIKPTYIRVGNSARITAVLYRIKPYGSVRPVTDQIDDPDAVNPFTGLGEKLADLLAETEQIKVTTHRLVFCSFSFNGQSRLSEGMPEGLRKAILQDFGNVTAHLIPILEDAPADCSQHATEIGQPAASDGGMVTVYVRGTISFLQDKIIIWITIAGELVASRECQKEQELQQRETIEKLNLDLWSGLNVQITRQRRE
jgi:hypothetical protein